MISKIKNILGIGERQPDVPSGYFSNYNLIRKGVVDGKNAYKGPNFVQIDLTNNCNNNCAGCWCHSLMLGDSMLKSEEKEKFIPLNILKKIIDDLAFLGTYEILLAGSGEPLMHPDIMEILTYIKNKGIRINLITNFSLVDKNKAKRLIDLGVDFITISLWAGTPETYVKTHPNTSKQVFERIKENLTYLNSSKKGLKPQIKIYNVLSKLNYFEIEQMVDFAVNTGSNFIEFTLIDTIPGKTDSLLLTNKEKNLVVKQFSEIRQKPNFFSEPNSKVSTDNENINSELESFGVFARELSLPKGFKFEGKTVKCPNERTNDVSYLKEEEDNKIVFEFFNYNKKGAHNCFECPNKAGCVLNETVFQIKLKATHLLGYGSLYRRLSASKDSQQYDVSVDAQPCYIGWLYSRILTNGDVIPCCKAHRMSLGNIYKTSFYEIWNSEEYNTFRYKAKNLKKLDNYFSLIGCYKSCDNIGMNMSLMRLTLKSNPGQSLINTLKSKLKWKY